MRFPPPILLVSLAGLYACTDGKIETDHTGVADTQIDTAGNDTDIENSRSGTSFEVRLDSAPGEHWRVGAFKLILGEDDLEIGVEVTSVAADSTTLTLEIPGLADSRIQESGGNQVTALFMAAYVDADESGAWNDQEAIGGASADIALYMEADSSGRINDTWFLVTLDLSGETEAEFGDIAQGVDITVFSMRDSYSFGGTTDATTSPTGTRMITLSFLEVATGAALPDRPLDVEFEGEFAFGIDGGLASSRLFEMDDGTEIGLEFPTLYLDSSEPSGPSVDDTYVVWACFEGETVGLAWLPGFTDLSLAFMALGTDLRPGWNAVQTSNDWEIISEADANDLLFSATACEFGEIE